MNNITNLSALIDVKKLDLDLAQNNVNSKLRYSNQWQIVKNRVDMLPKNIINELMLDVSQIKKTNIGKSIRIERKLTPIVYNGVEYPVSIIVYEKESIVTRAYYICFNNEENISYTRQIIGIAK